MIDSNSQPVEIFEFDDVESSRQQFARGKQTICLQGSVAQCRVETAGRPGEIAQLYRILPRNPQAGEIAGQLVVVRAG